MNIIIGLVGRKQAGKTTTFNIIQKHNPRVKELMLARTLKKACSSAFDLKSHLFEDPNWKEKPLDSTEEMTYSKADFIFKQFNVKADLRMLKKHVGKKFDTPRKIAQYVGTEMLRDLDPYIHCKKELEKIEDDNNIYVITDIRFKNEFDFFSSLPNVEFFPVYVERESSSHNKDTHASELEIEELKEECFVLENNLSIDELEKEIVARINPVFSELGSLPDDLLEAQYEAMDMTGNYQLNKESTINKEAKGFLEKQKNSQIYCKKQSNKSDW